MNLRILAIALLAASAASYAQAPSGSAIGSNTGGSASTNVPPPLPTTGTSGDTAGMRGTSPRGMDPGASTSAPTADAADRSSGRCDTLLGEERVKCLREQASTGTAGAGSTGMGSGATR
jgi:hypothetical protein